MTTSGRAIGRLAPFAAATVAAALLGCAPADPPAGGGRSAPAASHARMLDLLAEIKARTPEDNHWLGVRGARAARAALAALPDDTPPRERIRLQRAVAEHELRLGDTTAAIAAFEAAYPAAAALAAAEPAAAADLLELTFRLGVAYLRDGETRNCTQMHNAESLILPVRGGGVHADPAGSRRAIEQFTRVLEHTPRTAPLHLKAVWLLNLAYMTLGLYPDGVPESFRIPPAVFGAGALFKRFDNVAPAIGLATFNLSGAAIFDDFDGDDRVDLFTTTFDTAGDPRFFHNNGDGSFTDRTEQAGLRGLYGGLNAVHTDFDNDGDLDVYVLRGAWLQAAGRHPNSLLRNDGRGTFTDVTFAAGLGERHLPTQTAAFADFDNDGWVDLFVGHEHGTSPVEGTETSEFDAPCQLFRNHGDGTFTDVAPALGVDARAFVKGAVWGDVDGDRYPDLYLSVLDGPNLLFHTQRGSAFVERGREAGVVEPGNSFTAWVWDYDNDGHLDLYVSSYRGSKDSVALVAASYFGLEVPWDLPRLYRGDGRGGFTDVAQRAGLGRLHLTMGANFGDVDGDGYLDFYLGTGYPDYEGLMPNVLYHNERGAGFTDVTWPAGVGHLQKGHAVAFADYDQDGDLDLFAQMGGAFPGDAFQDALFRNPGFGHHWLTLHLVGIRTNRAALGARIRVDLIEAGRRRSIYRHVSSGGSFGGNALRQTIGLGAASAVERVEVFWPTSDTTQVFREVEMDRGYRIVEGADAPVPLPASIIQTADVP